MDKKYTKLKDLVNSSFTIEKVWGYKWKMWNQAENRMVSSEKWFEGAQKKWAIESDKGEFDVSDYQFGQMLAGCFSDRGSVIVGKTFDVKSNGKEGKDIRYFVNPSRGKEREAAPQKDVVIEDIPESNEVDLDQIPF